MKSPCLSCEIALTGCKQRTECEPFQSYELQRADMYAKRMVVTESWYRDLRGCGNW